MNESQVVIEEVMRAAMDAALKASARARSGDQHAAGQVYAYHNILDVFKQQADLIGLEIADTELAEFNPDVLLQKPRLVA